MPRFFTQFCFYFNPRSREGSDIGSITFDLNQSISIHAPAKGATYCCLCRAKCFLFQSTLPRRERPLPFLPAHPFLHFNPRSREGSDALDFFQTFYFSVFQSTLPRRERLLACSSCLGFENFNPRSREGSDSSLSVARSSHLGFQSTLPRRERPYNNYCDNK